MFKTQCRQRERSENMDCKMRAHLEEGVGQGEVVDALHAGIYCELGIHIEEDRHVDLLPWPQLLLLQNSKETCASLCAIQTLNHSILNLPCC